MKASRFNKKDTHSHGLVPHLKQLKQADVTIVGGGIVGLATARELLQRFPNKKVVLVERENRVARHQSSHNSGVIHAGNPIIFDDSNEKECITLLGLLWLVVVLKEPRKCTNSVKSTRSLTRELEN